MSRQLILTFVRHGETSLNVQKLIQGHTDTPLSETGINQAECLGKSIADVKFTKAYASDLCRAKRTAELILKHSQNPVTIVEDNRLRERSYGEMEGKYFQILIDEAAKNGAKMWEYTPKGAESFPQFVGRARSAFEDLCKDVEKSNAEEPDNYLIVTHGGWLTTLFRDWFSRNDKYILKNDHQAQIIRLSHNTGLTQCSISPATNENEKGKFIIQFLKINDTSHLNVN